MPEILEWVSIIASLGVIAVVIWGTIRIVKVLKLREIDTIGGFYAQLKTHLIVLKYTLGETANDSILDKLFSGKEEFKGSVGDKMRQQFWKTARSTIDHMASVNGQFYVNEEMRTNCNMLIRQLTLCQQWSSAHFNAENPVEEGYYVFIGIVNDTLAEIDNVAPAFLTGIWKEVDKAHSRRQRKKNEEQHAKRTTFLKSIGLAFQSFKKKFVRSEETKDKLTRLQKRKIQLPTAMLVAFCGMVAVFLLTLALLMPYLIPETDRVFVLPDERVPLAEPVSLDNIEFPGIETISVFNDVLDVVLFLNNEGGSNNWHVFELVLFETGEVLFKSERTSPDERVVNALMTRTLPTGEHRVELITRAYALNSTFEIGVRRVELILKVE